jgi:hypothetical protein
MNNQGIMAGYPASRAFDLEHLDGAAGAAAPSMLNLLLLALICDIPGVQT